MDKDSKVEISPLRSYTGGERLEKVKDELVSLKEKEILILDWFWYSLYKT